MTLSSTPTWNCHVTQDLGCYNDPANAHVLNTSVGGGALTTHEYCAGLCKFAGFGPTDVVGVEYGSQCRCGSSIKSGAEKINNTQCKMHCACNASQQCGAANIINIFRAECSPGPPAPVPLPSAPTSSVPCAPGPTCTIIRSGDVVALSNGFTCIGINITNPQIFVLAGDFTGKGYYGHNVLSGGGITLEREDIDGRVFASWTTGASKGITVRVNRTDQVILELDGVIDDASAAGVQETWTLSLRQGQRYFDFRRTGKVVRALDKTRAVRHSFSLVPTSLYAFFERGVVQMRNADCNPFYASADTLPRFYALGGNGNDLHTAGNMSIVVERTRSRPQMIRTVLHSTANGAPQWTGLEEVVVGNAPPLDQWTSGWNNVPAGSIAINASWDTTNRITPNNNDFPLFSSLVTSANLPDTDLAALLTGVYASPAGNLVTHDNGVAMGARVGQIATSLHSPKTGYADSYNYFDPDNYIATTALLLVGDEYLAEQVRMVLERTGSFINSNGQIPHHFSHLSPVWKGMGPTQTGPNIFWVLSCLNYAKATGNLEWLKNYMHILRNASNFLLDLFDPRFGLIAAPGSLFIDVFYRGNFTSDSNAMLVSFFREFADAERVIGNTTGATKLEELASQIIINMNKYLWESHDNDHYITQLNPDNTTRDFVDYDANFIALAHGVTSKDQAGRAFKRLDGGRCTHGRATFVSEKYYGVNDCRPKNKWWAVGDSWTAMGRIGWFDALARRRSGDQITFDKLLLNPLRDDLLRWTWLHERYGCEGEPQTNRTPYYFEYPSVVAMMLRQIRYGIKLGLSNITVAPFGPSNFTYHIGNVYVLYTHNNVSIMVPGHGQRWINIEGLLPSHHFSIRVTNCTTTISTTTQSDTHGVVTFRASIGDEINSCLITTTAITKLES